MVYFNNNATTWPKPDSVVTAVNEHLLAPPDSAERGGFKGKQVVKECRKLLAEFFHADDVNRVIFTSGSTEALNLAINGLPTLRHVVTTAVEHNSTLRPLRTLERDQGLRISYAPCDANGFVKPSDMERLITTNTDALVVNHCSNITGTLQDLQAISKIAKKHKIPLIVDASQSAGAVEINLKETPVDFLAFTGHKNLYGTTGIGGLVVNPNIKLKPLKVGGTGVRSDYPYQPEDLPLYYEAGTRNMVGIAALYAGLKHIGEKGLDAIHKAKADVYNAIVDGLKGNPNIHFYGTLSLERKLPVLNLAINGFDADELAYILDESYSISVRAGLHCAPLTHYYLGSLPDGTVRVSFSHFNTLAEAEYFVKSILEITNNIT